MTGFKPQPIRLSPRQAETIKWVSKGYSDKEISMKMDISIRTVHDHLRKAYTVLQVHSRVQAVRAAIRYGLIPFDPVFGGGE